MNRVGYDQRNTQPDKRAFFVHTGPGCLTTGSKRPELFFLAGLKSLLAEQAV